MNNGAHYLDGTSFFSVCQDNSHTLKKLLGSHWGGHLYAHVICIIATEIPDWRLSGKSAGVTLRAGFSAFAYMVK